MIKITDTWYFRFSQGDVISINGELRKINVGEVQIIFVNGIQRLIFQRRPTRKEHLNSYKNIKDEVDIYQRIQGIRG